MGSSPVASRLDFDLILSENYHPSRSYAALISTLLRTLKSQYSKVECYSRSQHGEAVHTIV